MQKFACWIRCSGETSAIFLAPMLLAFCLLGPLHPCAAAESLDLRLRIAWGGGESRLWRGSVTIGEATFSEPRGLGLDADSPGSLFIDGDTIRIAPRSPTNFEGMDVLVTAPGDASVVVELVAIDRPTEVKRITVAFEQLLTEFHNTELDDRGNRFLIRRAPGDQLRIDYQRESLVFSPEEAFTFRVTPHHTGVAVGSSLRAVLQVVEGRTTQEVWSYEQECVVAEGGHLPVIAPEAVVLPKKEGAYDLVVSLYHRKLTDKFLRSKPIVQRKLQFVVVDDRPPPADIANWRDVGEIDPTSDHWWDRLSRLPGFTRLPGYSPDPLGNAAVSRMVDRDLTWMRVDRGGWKAYPLPIAGKGRPHILEVEFPADSPHILGISIIEPNAAGAVTPIGLDSGVEVVESPRPSPARVGRHRIVFWPRTNSPFVLLTNRGENRPAMFGKIRVLAGPRALSGPVPTAPLSDERMLAALFEKPLFNKNFMAEEALDERTGRSLDDWQTFLDGTRRFVQYLKYAGYNSAVVGVVCEGSSLYPSQLLAPTPKYDNGAFFYTGQDPQRKDVLELLFRLFDREGLKLIPAVQFATPLPALEDIKRRGPVEADGLELVGADGRTWLVARGTRRGLAPYYNPLDLRVQAAMRQVVREITERYDHHRSFAGVALQLGSDSYAQLPGETWGYDNRTLKRFAAETKVELPDEVFQSFSHRVSYLREDGRAQWLTWRSRALADFYGELQQDLTVRRRMARLFLNTADLFGSAEFRSDLRPALPAQPSIADTLLRYGLDLELLQTENGIVIPRPHRGTPLADASTRMLGMALNDSEDIDRHYHSHATPGSLFFHESAPLRVADFEAASPFGAANTQTWLLAHVPPALEQNRRRFVHAIAKSDTRLMIDGGWMLPLGQEAATRELALAFRQLPDHPFQTVRPASNESLKQPLVVRRLVRGDRTFVYLVNDFPWPIHVDLDMSAPVGCQLTPLGTRTLPPLTRGGSGSRWSLELDPYDFIAVQFNSADVVVRDWQTRVEPDVVPRLRQQLQQVRGRANQLLGPPAFDLVPNPGFEDGEGRNVDGWIFARGDGISVAPDETNPRRGRRCLHIKSDGPVVWVRSDPFPPPRTGRAFVMVWLRVRDAERQPPFRLAIEARTESGPYYRFSTVGADTKFAIENEWGTAPYLAPLELPPEGVTELRVEFDLMGAGELWIDDVQIHHLYFHESERSELRKQIALADYQLDNQRLADCYQFLSSYWPRFLNDFLPPANRVAAAAPPVEPQPAAPPRRPAVPMRPAAKEPEAPAPAERTSRWDRIKDYLPKKVLPF